MTEIIENSTMVGVLANPRMEGLLHFFQEAVAAGDDTECLKFIPQFVKQLDRNSANDCLGGNEHGGRLSLRGHLGVALLELLPNDENRMLDQPSPYPFTRSAIWQLIFNGWANARSVEEEEFFERRVRTFGCHTDIDVNELRKLVRSTLSPLKTPAGDRSEGILKACRFIEKSSDQPMGGNHYDIIGQWLGRHLPAETMRLLCGVLTSAPQVLEEYSGHASQAMAMLNKAASEAARLIDTAAELRTFLLEREEGINVKVASIDFDRITVEINLIGAAVSQKDARLFLLQQAKTVKLWRQVSAQEARLAKIVLTWRAPSTSADNGWTAEYTVD